MHKGTLGIHEVKLMIQTSPSFSDGCGVTQHAYSTLHLGQVPTRHNSGWLIVDSDLKASRTPINKLDSALGLDGGNSSINILGHNITPVEEAASHVFAMAWITFDHLIGRLKAGICYLSDRKLLMISFLRGDDRCIGHKREVDPGIWHQVGLKLGKIHIESTIESKRSSDG